MEQEIVIYRGLPGSGKDFDIERRLESGEWLRHRTAVCSADDYWIEKYGEYLFKREEASQAHGWCFRQVLGIVLEDFEGQGELDRIVVSNTNVRQAEYSPYAMIASAYGATLRIVETHCDLETAVERNIHGVGRDILEYMARSWEEVLPWHRNKVERVDS